MCEEMKTDLILPNLDASPKICLDNAERIIDRIANESWQKHQYATAYGLRLALLYLRKIWAVLNPPAEGIVDTTTDNVTVPMP